MNERRSIVLVMVLFAAFGCDTRPPAIAPDAGPPRDAGPRMDAGPSDAGPIVGMDGGDAGMDAGGSLPDGSLEPDTGLAPRDAGPDAFDPMVIESGLMEVDGSFDLDAAFVDIDGGVDPDAGAACRGPNPDMCLCSSFAPCATTSQCGEGQICAPDPTCGIDRCTPAGHFCTDTSQCASGSTCEARGPHNICVAPSGCNDSRDCPLGFACEASSCVDRRVGCDELTDCPFGFVCSSAGGGGLCIRFPNPCASDSGCFFGECRDVDGLPGLECVSPGACDSNTECPVAGEVCGSAPVLVSTCGSYGYCAGAADCASGYECLDLWGDGKSHCVRTGGACSAASPCAPGAICAPPSATAPPACVTGS